MIIERGKKKNQRVHTKKHLFWSFFLKQSILKPIALLEKRLYQMCFTMSFIKFY